MSTCSERLGHKHKQTPKQIRQTDGGMDGGREGDRGRKRRRGRLEEREERRGEDLNISH